MANPASLSSSRSKPPGLAELGGRPATYFHFPKGGPRTLVTIAREGQWIDFPHGVELVILRIDGEKVTVGVNAPPGVAVRCP
jgi:hypothetical protein